MTAVTTILLAAGDLDRAGKAEFSEWELTAAAWGRDKQRFGMRGMEHIHPDHKRVSMELMCKNKVNSPIAQGWLVRCRPNTYRLTSLGRLEVDRNQRPQTTSELTELYDALAPWALHPAFLAWCNEPAQPEDFAAVRAFLRGEPFAQVRATITRGIEFCLSVGLTELPRTSGRDRGEPIRVAVLSDLEAFCVALGYRFPRLAKGKRSA